MMFNEIKSGDIPSLSFLKGTNYAMYIGPELNPKQVQLLKSDDIPVPVLYLPEILEQLSDSVLKYNFPGVSMPENFSAETIYEQIRAEFEGRLTPESRLIVKYNGDVLVIYDAKESFSLVISYLINMCAPPAPRRIRRSMWGEIKKRSYCNDDIEELIDECKKLEIEPDYAESDIRFSIRPSAPESVEEEDTSHLLFRRTTEEPIAEKTFDAEMNKALQDVQTMIQDLLLKGCPPEIILKLLNQSVKLSRIRITRQYKIFLVDYDNVEIKMGPLPKTVFLFYLRHPEGVAISYLQNHKRELRDIYGRVCTNDDPEKMKDSIERLTNPFDNSICEKCAAIKKAFTLKINEQVAQNYFVHGEQGEKKGISLDRNLVQWECEL